MTFSLFFLGSIQTLHLFLGEINTIHPTIKFTMSHTTPNDQELAPNCSCQKVKSIPYLDTSCEIKAGKIVTELSIDATKSQFKTATVGARSRDVSPDIHYSIFSDSHSPNLRAAPCRRTCSQTRYMNENLSSLLRLYSTLKNSGKSSVVVWKNLPMGGPLDTQTYPRVNLSILGTTLG